MTQQLVYGSADQIAGRQVGGWGVLHASADLTPETQRTLLGLTSVALPTTLPQFPSAQQLAHRAVRFRLDPMGREYAACRSVEAGTDHTGRPGNVVSHCARLEETPGLRPVDWYFSPGWVAPFGPRQIAETVPPAALPAPGGWADTAAWLRGDAGRMAALRWIVDVGLATLLGSQRVILRVPNPDEGARWASVLSWLLDDGVAGMIRIRIGEDQRSAIEQLGVAPVIVAVTADLDPGALRGLPVLDTGWRLEPQDGRWVLPTGQSFAASSSTQLAADLVYAPGDVALAVFGKRDELVERFTATGARLEVRHEALFLQAAWLTTPGAQDLAREEPIRQLLEGLDEGLRGWDEFAALAAETGTPVQAEDDTVDVYSMAPEPADPWAVDEADPLELALGSAARLGAAGVDLAELLRDRTLLDAVDDRPAEEQQWLRDVAAVLPHANGEVH